MASYFLYGYYGFGNFGDDLLLSTLISGIRERDNDARFVVRARAPVAEFVSDPSVRFLLAEKILEDHRRSRLSRFLAYRSVLVAEARRCDVSLVGGGTLFIDKGRINWSLLFIHEVLRAARSAGRRTVVTGVAIDILAYPLSVWLTQRIFALADFSAVRDALSLAYFQAVKSPPRQSADLAWLWPQPSFVPTARTRRAVGLNFIDYYRSSTRNPAGHAAYREALHRLIGRHRAQCDFHLVALQRGIGQCDDWLAEEFQNLVPNGRVFYVEDAGSLSVALSGIDAIITTRFHLALLAARVGVPTCIIDHELKLTSLAQDLRLPAMPLTDFIAADDGPDPLDLLAAWDGKATQRSVRRQATRAELNFDWLQQ